MSCRVKNAKKVGDFWINSGRMMEDLEKWSSPLGGLHHMARGSIGSILGRHSGNERKKGEEGGSRRSGGRGGGR